MPIVNTIISPGLIFPVSAAPVAGMSLLVADGKISRIAPAEILLRANPDAGHVVLPNHIVTPGLINAHCHLELGYLRSAIPPGHFADWVKQLMLCVLARKSTMEETVAESVRGGIAELIAGGVTFVGDISKQIAASRSVLREGPIRAISFGEVAGFGARRGLLAEALSAAIDRRYESCTLRCSVSPHAPYTVEGTALREVIAAAKQLQWPICMHLAELAEEREFLAALTGRLSEPWNIFGTAHEMFDERIPRHAGGPVRWAKDFGLFSAAHPPLLAHVNYADDDELAIIKTAGASVAYCPRTHDFFGHPPHRFRDMLRMGINVCLATDSLASNPDLYLMREAGFLLQRDRSLSPGLLLEMITRRAAGALGLPADHGTLSAGAPADIAAFEIPAGGTNASAEALASVMLSDGKASDVWIAGDKVI